MYNILDMQPNQTISYIQQHLQQGHTEADIRSHLLRNGWPQTAVDQAFADYHAVMGSQASPSLPLVAPNTPASANVGRAPLSARKRLPKWLWAVPAATVLAVGIVLALHFITSPKTLDRLAQPAAERTAQNNAREVDANEIVAAMGNYISNYNGTLPQSVGSESATVLDICAARCDENKTTADLRYYKPGAVSLQAYAAGLTVPDAQTIYVVNGATCNQAKDGLGGKVSTGQVAVVVLYGLAASSGVQQKCLGL